MAGLIQTISDWLLYAVGTVVALVGGYVRRVDTRSQTALDKAEQNERRLIGDGNDPNAEGLLQIAHDTRDRVNRVETKVESFRETTRGEHRAVMDKLEDMDDTPDENT